MDYMEAKELIDHLAISPDLYECFELNEFIYETFAGGMDIQELTALDDGINEIYKELVDRVARKIPRKYAQDPYKLHRWLSPTTLVIGEV